MVCQIYLRITCSGEFIISVSKLLKSLHIGLLRSIVIITIAYCYCYCYCYCRIPTKFVETRHSIFILSQSSGFSAISWQFYVLCLHNVLTGYFLPSSPFISFFPLCLQRVQSTLPFPHFSRKSILTELPGEIHDTGRRGSGGRTK